MDVIFEDGSWKTVTNEIILKGDSVSLVDSKYCEKVDRDKYSVQLGSDNYRVPAWSYVNHSCQPSFKIKERDSSFLLVALRTVMSDEEVTFNYIQNEDQIAERFDCNCGDVDCVGEVNK